MKFDCFNFVAYFSLLYFFSFFLQQKLRFNVIQHLVTKIDCQPTTDSGVVLLVTGQLKVQFAVYYLQKCNVINKDQNLMAWFQDRPSRDNRLNNCVKVVM
jgi:hypothetical protein